MSSVHKPVSPCDEGHPDDTTKRMAIGLFDSGVGGLTVLDALRRCLPREDFLYLGDTARLPYGTKSPETITRYALQAARQLVDRKIKLLVVACNTVSAVALPALEAAFGHIPVIGVVRPGALAACRASQSGSIAVMATTSTTRGGAYVRAIRHLRPEARVYGLATPLLVPMAEEGWFEGSLVEGIIARYLEPLVRQSRSHDELLHNQDKVSMPLESELWPELLHGARTGTTPDVATDLCTTLGTTFGPERGPELVSEFASDLVADPAEFERAESALSATARENMPDLAGAVPPIAADCQCLDDLKAPGLEAHAVPDADDVPDCLVLGCTHFPMLLPAIRQVVGPDMVLVDSAVTTALAVRERLRADHLESPNAGGRVHFLTTDDIGRFAATGSMFLRFPIAQNDVELVDL